MRKPKKKKKQAKAAIHESPMFNEAMGLVVCLLRSYLEQQAEDRARREKYEREDALAVTQNDGAQITPVQRNGALGGMMEYAEMNFKQYIESPDFVIRAKDLLAPSTLKHWINEAEAHGVNPDKIARAKNHLAAISAYQRSHGAKIPD